MSQENVDMKNPIDKYVKLVTALSGKYSVWEIWNDYITLFAISLSNAFEHQYKNEREEEYLKITKKYSREELDKYCELAAMLIGDMEKNPDYDYLGEVYMKLRISSKAKGQYFTPYHISKLMAKIVIGENAQDPCIINEPTCGSGANIIAAANVMREKGYNYQQNAYFVAQDIDPLVAKMCYIQMSLLGMPGIVIIGNTLLNTSEEKDHWYTPFHYLFGTQILMRHKKRIEEESNQSDKQSICEKDWLLNLVGLA